MIDPGDGGEYRADLDPANFVEGIDNPYLPFRPGARWVYEGAVEEGTERIEVTVTDERKEILGIPATVVRDTVTVDGELLEDTNDWYAQDLEPEVVEEKSYASGVGVVFEEKVIGGEGTIELVEFSARS